RRWRPTSPSPMTTIYISGHLRRFRLWSGSEWRLHVVSHEESPRVGQEPAEEPRPEQPVEDHREQDHDVCHVDELPLDDDSKRDGHRDDDRAMCDEAAVQVRT